MLVLSEPPKFNVTLSPIETWDIPCCICSPTRQRNDSIVVVSDLPKKLAKRSIHLHASATLVLYGSLSQQEGRSVGPAVFFHSPVALESHAFQLRIPMYGAASSCDCRVIPFIGAYDQYSLTYKFQSCKSNSLIYTYKDPSHIVIRVKDTVIFRPSCTGEHVTPPPCCPAFEYEVRLYQLACTEARRFSFVVFIKSRLWEAVSSTYSSEACSIMLFYSFVAINQC